MKAPNPSAWVPGRAPVASFRLRILFRSVFLLLAAATIILAVVLLQDEKERSYRNYHLSLSNTHAEVLARLRQPAGLLALLNREPYTVPPVTPLVLPFPALDFQDQNMVHQLVEQAACPVRYPDGSTLCVAVGGTDKAAGFLYIVGSFFAGALAGFDGSSSGLDSAHRASIRIETPEQKLEWLAPFEGLPGPDEALVRGRIAAFAVAANDGTTAATTAPATALPTPEPVRDFRGGLWQSASCAAAGTLPDCSRRVFYAMRLPVKALREHDSRKSHSHWPPKDLARMKVHVKMLAPGAAKPLFDSDMPGAQAPEALAGPVQSLKPGEALTVTRLDLPEGRSIVLEGREPPPDPSSPLLLRLVSELPVASPSRRIVLRDTLVTPVGSYEVRLAGDTGSIDPALGAVATRISWYVSAMLIAIVIAWLVIEVGLIRRITALSRRAAALSHNARGSDRIGQLEVADLRGPDELGILAGGLADLLQRVKDDLDREEMRSRQEREMLEAVGHEILSPLQSLMVLFPDPGGPAYRYVQRMRQAVSALYGQASPREALQAAQLELAALDIDEFLFHVASNAEFAGIRDVDYRRVGKVIVQADEFSLEDVVTHILRNADRHRQPGTRITISLQLSGKRAIVRIHNVGSPLEQAQLERIFEYGVREVEGEAEGADAHARRGQGLFVARTYMSKMRGSVDAVNEDGGVAFRLELPLASAS
jgi:signal transduction histidine kinase